MDCPKNDCELTILMPCLNESETLRVCIEKAKLFLNMYSVKGEVLVADNGSADGSREIAAACGARVIDVPERGYGAALIGGCAAALGEYVIMGDADDSYDFTSLMPFLEKLRFGDELVMGNRFKGGIGKGAMPLLHKYLGNPVLSFLGRLFYPSDIGDFHSGLRGYKTEAIRKLRLHTTGMEYASEMVVQAALNGLKISEVPIVLHQAGRSRSPHLRSWRDGWRHLKFLLTRAPNWLFFVPGLSCFILGFTVTGILLVTPVRIGTVTFDVNTMVYMIILMIVGINILSFGVISKVYAIHSRFIPISKRSLIYDRITAENGTLSGFILIAAGLVVSVIAFVFWGHNDFGKLNASEMLRITLPSLALIIIGIQFILTAFLLDIIRIKDEPRETIQS
jgi:glycosyltransferase involved in cell wall biosynthesis